MPLTTRKPFFARFWGPILVNLLVGGGLTFISLSDVLFAPSGAWVEGQPAPIYHRAPVNRKKGVLDDRFIVRRGEPVTAPKVSFLEATYPEHHQFDMRRAAGVLAFYFLALTFFNVMLRRAGSRLYLRFRAVASVYLTLVITALGARLLLDYTPLSPYIAPTVLVAVLFAPLLGQARALAVHLLAVVLVAHLSHFTPGMILIPLVSGWTVVLLLPREQAWWRLLLAAAVGTVVGGAFMFGLDLFSPQQIDFGLGLESDLTGLVGGNMGAAVIALLFGYPLTRFFGSIPRWQLIALNDLDHPLMRDLAEKAPGSFQHSLAVANMAEKVANDIDADAPLVRVGAYYHDIGKMHEPEYFIENQKGENPHNRLSPEASAEKLRGHVVDGVSIARGANLPGRVIDFIVEHHGLSMMEYFLDKAFQLEGKAPDPSRFEYRGRNPTSRETGILMIVDAVEAASRTLKSPTHDQVEDMVRRIVFGKLLYGYLDDCGLSTKELKKIGISLIQFLVAQFHVRIEYPWQKRVDRPPLVIVPDLQAGVPLNPEALRVAKPFLTPVPGSLPAINPSLPPAPGNGSPTDGSPAGGPPAAPAPPNGNPKES